MQHDDHLVVVSQPGVNALLIGTRRGIELVAASEGLVAGLVGSDARVVVLIDGSAIVTSRTWLDDLAAAVSAPSTSVLAAAPRSNGAAWPQCPPGVMPTDAKREAIRAMTQHCARDRAEWFSVERLSGPCVALRPEVAAQVGRGEPTIAAISDALSGLGTGVTVLPELYVHATEAIPQISVAMIMKNEAAELADCLASVRSLADEIVIYDTGSTDGSVELARSLGAVVIEGEWRNDFAWARNQALQAARGTWILSIDADERLEIDHAVVPEIRGLLSDNPPVDRFIIELFDLQGSVHAPVRSNSGVPMARLFRRVSCRWVGALHEQPDIAPGGPPVRSVSLPGIRYLHRGYLDEYVKGRNKWVRNLEVAVASLDVRSDSDKECFDLGRSLRSVGEHARAFTMFERAAQLAQNATITRGALEFAVLVLCETGQAAATAPYLERLEALVGGEGPARYLRGWTHIHLSEWEDAVRCFEGVADYHDNFTGFRAESVPLALSLAYRGLGRPEEASIAAQQALNCNDQAMEAWAVLFDCAADDADAMRTVASSLDLDRLVPVFAKLQRYPVGARDRLANAIWETHPGNLVVLAVGSQLAGALALDRRLVWSERLRRNGLGQLCPLRTVADDGSHTVAERAAVLVRAVHELDAIDLTPALEELVGLLHDHELASLLTDTMQRFPAAAGSVVVAGATSATRCHAIVTCLAAHGCLEEAMAVLDHGASLDGDVICHLLGANPALVRTLLEAAQAAGRSDLVEILPNAA